VIETGTVNASVSVNVNVSETGIEIKNATQKESARDAESMKSEIAAKGPRRGVRPELQKRDASEL
jgi:hypothetical protein